jgi:hypothetical protein
LFNPLNAELNSICHLLALLGAHPVFHVSRIRVKVRLCYSGLNHENNKQRSDGIFQIHILGETRRIINKKY